MEKEEKVSNGFVEPRTSKSQSHRTTSVPNTNTNPGSSSSSVVEHMPYNQEVAGSKNSLVLGLIGIFSVPSAYAKPVPYRGTLLLVFLKSEEVFCSKTFSNF